jgi:hypothetical protein
MNKAKRALYSINRLSDETGRNQRTIARALADTPPDGRIAGRPAFHLATALDALAAHERRTGRQPNRSMPPRADHELETKIAELEAATEQVDAFLKTLRAEPTVEGRRALDAKCIGRLDRALAATIGTGSGAFLRKVFCDDQMGQLIAEVMALCEWTVKPEAAA